MGFFRRLFRREKQRKPDGVQEVDPRAREARLEKAWIGGWSSGAQSEPATKRSRTQSIRASKATFDFQFDEYFLGTSRTTCNVRDGGAKAKTATALEPAAGTRKNATSAQPPLPTIPGALLSFPRFQEYVYTFLKDEIVPVGESTNRHSAHEHGESDLVEPLTPGESIINGESAERSNAHLSLTLSLVNSMIPSLIYTDGGSSSPSTESARSLTADTSYTGSPVTSTHSFLSSSSISSYLSRRHAGEKRKGQRHARSGRKMRTRECAHGREKTRCSSAPQGDTTLCRPVQNANTYVGSRSMSGPYPCISSRRQPKNLRLSTTSSTNGDYYP